MPMVLRSHLFPSPPLSLSCANVLRLCRSTKAQFESCKVCKRNELRPFIASTAPYPPHASPILSLHSHMMIHMQKCGKEMDCVTRFAFEGDCRGRNKWRECNFEVHELTKVFRQSKREFIDLLQHVRKGIVQSRHLEVSTGVIYIDFTAVGEKSRASFCCACVLRCWRLPLNGRCFTIEKAAAPLVADMLSPSLIRRPLHPCSSAAADQRVQATTAPRCRRCAYQVVLFES